MYHFKFYQKAFIKSITRKRHGETKLGEAMACIEDETAAKEFLEASPAKFVVFGIPEDVGVRANYGRGGAHTAWKPALENIVNLQSNHFLNAKDIIVLGEMNLDDVMEQSQSAQKDEYSIEKLRKLVEIIDARVIEVVELIVSCKKIPIVIGGGHNNAYPLIKGSNEALRRCCVTKHKGINVINCDAHTDFRTLEGRHSGNGFSYAFDEGSLNKYAVLAMHEQYNPENIIQKFSTNPDYLFYSSYEDIFIREKETFLQSLQRATDFCQEAYCGIDLDLDSITNVPSSARTSSGISPVQARQYVYYAAKNVKPAYLHIAEGAPILAHIKADYKTGKLIAYLVSDFIKGVLEKE